MVDSNDNVDKENVESAEQQQNLEEKSEHQNEENKDTEIHLLGDDTSKLEQSQVQEQHASEQLPQEEHHEFEQPQEQQEVRNPSVPDPSFNGGVDHIDKMLNDLKVDLEKKEKQQDHSLALPSTDNDGLSPLPDEKRVSIDPVRSTGSGELDDDINMKNDNDNEDVKMADTTGLKIEHQVSSKIGDEVDTNMVEEKNNIRQSSPSLDDVLGALQDKPIDHIKPIH
ncbi:unnamed protein product [Ambrosiozyma monospora]|uniref:Unnamed protein product n=1 Tax=Ambrosiozyma monospora TaxID=43982 RepID=A0ACB5UC97_AMBMO|nr:unnamed protein product [Ambrosiozyma monospora]